MEFQSKGKGLTFGNRIAFPATYLSKPCNCRRLNKRVDTNRTSELIPTDKRVDSNRARELIPNRIRELIATGQRELMSTGQESWYQPEKRVDINRTRELIPTEQESWYQPDKRVDTNRTREWSCMAISFLRNGNSSIHLMFLFSPEIHKPISTEQASWRKMLMKFSFSTAVHILISQTPKSGVTF